MPLYDYHCPKCGPLTAFRPVADRDAPCEACGESMIRAMTAPAVVASHETRLERDGMIAPALREKAWIERPEIQAQIATGEKGVALRGPKSLQPTMPARRSY